MNLCRSGGYKPAKFSGLPIELRIRYVHVSKFAAVFQIVLHSRGNDLRPSLNERLDAIARAKPALQFMTVISSSCTNIV